MDAGAGRESVEPLYSLSATFKQPLKKNYITVASHSGIVAYLYRREQPSVTVHRPPPGDLVILGPAQESLRQALHASHDLQQVLATFSKFNMQKFSSESTTTDTIIEGYTHAALITRDARLVFKTALLADHLRNCVVCVSFLSLTFHLT